MSITSEELVTLIPTQLAWSGLSSCCRPVFVYWVSYYNLDLSVRLSVYYLLRCLWTDCDQTWQEGQGWSNLEP